MRSWVYVTHWCLLSNPAIYDVERALMARRVILWSLGRRQRLIPEPGDPVLVWRTLAADRHRGLIAYGVVDGPVALAPDEDPLWVDPAREIVIARQVPVRWWPLESPLWFEDAPEVLGALKVSRSQGLPMVAEDADVWNEAARLARVQQELAQTDIGSRGQGWRVVVEQRLVVEEAAMNAARAYYDRAGYSIEDVHLRMPFDLRCTRGIDELHVEVKGTTSGAEHVLLTVGEVRHARNCAHAVLFVLTGVRVILDRDETLAAGGDVPLVIDPWVPSDDDLEALAYRYTIPATRLPCGRSES